MWRRWLLAALLSSTPGPVAAQEGASSPPGKVLHVQGKVLDVEGITLGMEAVLRDLGAEVSEREIRIALASDVLFDFDSDALRAEAQPSLEKLATVVAGQPGASIRIEGHTDSKGSDAYNQALSERRARAVERWLVERGGAAAADVTTQGFGETQPRVPNEKPDGTDDPAGRQQNRRVEVVILRG